RLATSLCVVDPENSVFFDFYRTGSRAASSSGSRIEGIGRPRVEPSFIPDVVDRMIKVPDVLSLAAMRVLSTAIGRRVGGSTGTNLVGALQLMAEMRASGRRGSIVTLICDSGVRYENSYHNDAWLTRNGFDIAGPAAAIHKFLETGSWDASLAQSFHERTSMHRT